MQRRIIAITGFAIIALLIVGETALYTSAVNDSRTYYSDAISLFGSYSKDLLSAWKDADTVRLHVLTDEIFRRSAKNRTTESVRFDLVSAGQLLSWNSGQTFRSAEELRLQVPEGTWSIRFRVLDDTTMTLMLRIALISLLFWSGLSLVLALSTPKVPKQKESIDGVQTQVENETQINTATTEAVTKTESEPLTNESSNAEETPPASETLNITKKDDPQTLDQTRDFLYRLDKELQRCAEFAVDLSLCLVRFPALQESAVGRAVLEEDFSHEDLIFQLKKDLFAVILPHQDLDQAMARSEMFIRSLDRSAEHDENLSACVTGLSSRSGRLVDAKRLHREAQVAIRKTDLHNSRMTGFRADPVRYRSFLTHQKI